MQTTLLILYLLSISWAIFSILLYGSRPARSIGWLLFVIILPFAGVLLYIIFGINRKKFKFFKLNFNAKRKLYDLNHKSDSIEEFAHKFDAEKYSKIGSLLKKSSGFPAVDGNKVDLLLSGETAFESIFEAFSKAKKFIHIQYYILEEGDILNKLLALFKDKVKEGVEIRILYDAFGSYGWKNKSVKKLEELGVEVHAILPLKFGSILSTLNYRNHRKIAVIDGIVAFTGGINISDKYIKSNTPLGIWDDMHLKIEGAAVDHLHRIFIKDFYFANNNELLSDKKYTPHQEKKGDSLVQIVTGGPDHSYASILHQYIMMIHASETSIYIENPYFIPNKAMLESLKMAALRGVIVKIIVPEKNDSKVAKHSMYSNFETLLEAGVEICILKEKFSHSKLIIVDEKIASIGSGNFDFRSFEHNYEVNTLLYDDKLASTLSRDFKENLEKCNILNYNSFKNRDIRVKLLEGFAKIFSPLL